MRLNCAPTCHARSLRDIAGTYGSLFAILVAFAITPAATGAIIFAEDFEDITLSSNPLPLTTSTSGSSFTAAVATGSTSRVAARTDAANNFGDGTGNKVLHFVDGGPSTTAALRGPTSSTITTAFTLSFDFYDPFLTTSTVGAGEPITAGTHFYMNNVNTGGTAGDRAVQFSIGRGNIHRVGSSGSDLAGTYSSVSNVMHNMTVVGNLTGSPLNYYKGGAQTVASKTYDIFLDGVLLAGGNNVAFRNALATQISFFTVAGTGNGSVSEGYFDNFVLEDSLPVTPVPEPSALLLVTLGLPLAVAMRRRYAYRND